MGDHQTSRRSRQMTFGRIRDGAASEDEPPVVASDATRPAIEFHFPPLELPDVLSPAHHRVARDGAAGPSTLVDGPAVAGNANDHAALVDLGGAPATPFGKALRRAIARRLNDARRAFRFPDAPPGFAADTRAASDPESDMEAEIEAEERQARSFIDAWRRARLARGLSAVGRGTAGFMRASRDQARRAIAGLDAMRTRVYNWVLRANGVVEDDDDFQFPALERGEGWSIRDDSTIAKHRVRGGELQSNVNRVDFVWFTKNDGKPDAFFKPEAPPDKSAVPGAHNFKRNHERYRFAARAVMTYAIDQALGTGVMAREEFAVLENPLKGKTEMGNLSYAADGRALKESAVDERSNGGPTFVDEFATDVPFRSEAFQRGISDLQVVDWLTGQIDRHGGNIFYTPAGKITGIDNDQAFVGSDDPTNWGNNRGLPPLVHAQTAEAIRRITPEALEQLLNGSVPPSERLTASELSSAKARLAALQTHLGTAGVVVSRFDDDTFDRMRNEDGSSTTYAEEHARAVEDAVQHGGHKPWTETNLEDGTSKLRRNVIDPNADVSSWKAKKRAARGAAADRARSAAASSSAIRNADDGNHGDRSGTAPLGTASAPASMTAAPEDGSDARRRSQSGEAETKGDERHLGPGGESGRGEATSYSRWVHAFGRNEKGTREKFKAHWDEVELLRQKVELPIDAPAGEEAAAKGDEEAVDGDMPRGAPQRRLRFDVTKVAGKVDWKGSPTANNNAYAEVTLDPTARDDGRAPERRTAAELAARPFAYLHAKGDRFFYKPDTGIISELTAWDFVMPGHGTVAELQQDGRWDALYTGDNDWHLAERAALSGLVDSWLGFGVLVQDTVVGGEQLPRERLKYGEYLAEHGVLSPGGDGVPVKVAVDEDGDRRFDDDGFDFKRALTQQGLSRLQIEDFITGQKDRHNGNVLITRPAAPPRDVASDPARLAKWREWQARTMGAVTAYDNDMAFGTGLDPSLDRNGKPHEKIYNRGMPNVVHVDDAMAMLSLSLYGQWELLQSKRALDAREIEASIERTRLLQGELLKAMRGEPSKVTVVSDWNEDSWHLARAGGTYVNKYANSDSNAYVEDTARDDAFRAAERQRRASAYRDPEMRAKLNALALERQTEIGLLAERIASATRLQKEANAIAEARRAADTRSNTSTSDGEKALAAARPAADARSNQSASGGVAAIEQASTRKDASAEEGSDASTPELPSGQAETTGDERHLGNGGDEGYGTNGEGLRPLRGFGRDPNAVFDAFKRQWAWRRERLAWRGRKSGAEDGARAKFAQHWANATSARQQWLTHPPIKQEKGPVESAQSAGELGVAASTWRAPELRLPGSEEKWALIQPGDVKFLERKEANGDNTVDVFLYQLATPLPGAQDKVAFYKPDTQDRLSSGPQDVLSDWWDMDRTEQGWRMASRAVLTSLVDDLLGTSVSAREALAVLEVPSAALKPAQAIKRDDFGQIIQNATPAEDEGTFLNYGNLSAKVGGEPLKHTHRDLSKPVTQRGLSDLQVLDWITGQKDRHPGNIFIDDEGRVMGIDNDRAFGRGLDPSRILVHTEYGVMTKFGNSVGFPPIVHRETAERVLALSADELRAELQKGVPSGAGLTEKELDGAVARLEKLQTELQSALEGKGGATLVVDRFDHVTHSIASNQPSNHAVNEHRSYIQVAMRLRKDLREPRELDHPTVQRRIEKERKKVRMNGYLAQVLEDRRRAKLAAPATAFARAKETARRIAMERAQHDADAARADQEEREALAARKANMPWQTIERMPLVKLDEGPTIDGAADDDSKIQTAPGDAPPELQSAPERRSSEMRHDTEHDTVGGGYKLQRRSHAGPAPRVDHKKTPARGSKDSKPHPIGQHRKHNRRKH